MMVLCSQASWKLAMWPEIDSGDQTQPHCMLGKHSTTGDHSQPQKTTPVIATLISEAKVCYIKIKFKILNTRSNRPGV